MLHRLTGLHDIKELISGSGRIVSKGRGLSDVLVHDLKVQAHSSHIAASNHTFKFSLPGDIPDEDSQDQDVMLKKFNYGTPGLDNYRNNMVMAVLSLDFEGNVGVRNHNIMGKSACGKQDDVQYKSSYVQKVIVDVLHYVAERLSGSKSVDFILPKLIQMLLVVKTVVISGTTLYYNQHLGVVLVI